MPISKRFMSVCQQCKALCCTVHQPPVSEKEKRAILKAGNQDCFIRIKNGIYEIEAEDNGRCPFLENDYSCSIQEVKPKLCRTWPVIPRYKQGKRDCIVVKCPLFPLLSKREIQQAKREAESLPLALVKQLWKLPPAVKNTFKRFGYDQI